MDASLIIAGWKQRLTALAENPEYVFRDTPQHLIEQHHRGLTTFAGYSEEEVAAAEARLGVRLPAVFRTYLREIAKSPGDLFRGSHLAGISEFEQFRADALELLAETDPALTLPPEAVVFLSHQGYTFVYLLAVGGFDGPPMQWTETERQPRQVAATFADMVDAELQLMESNNRGFREKGGYYLTLHPGGGATQSHPALASGERPLDLRRASGGGSSGGEQFEIWRSETAFGGAKDTG
jgi:hypothetical protein